MRQNIDRVLVVDQGIETVARGVLDFVFMADARGQRFIGAGSDAHARKLIQQSGVALTKACHAVGVFGVEHRAIAQNHAHTGHRAVAVLRRAAAHARRVVSRNTADLAGVDGGRVGTNLAAKRCQPEIDLSANDARANAHCGGIRADLTGGKSFADQGQHAVCHGLAR